MNNIVRIAGLALASMLAACGTTGSIQPTAKPQAVVGAPAPKGGVPLDLSGYDRVVVLDVVDATNKSGIKPADLRAYSATMATAVRTFPDLIAQKLRGPNPGKALRISGRITRLTDGNSSLRLFIGMGAGSAYFDAATELADD